MGLFGIFVLGVVVWQAVTGTLPGYQTMGVVGFAALAVNLLCALLLLRFREGDSNMRSVWLCSRNDAIGNVAVVIAAAGVFALSASIHARICSSVTVSDAGRPRGTSGTMSSIRSRQAVTASSIRPAATPQFSAKQLWQIGRAHV